MPQPATEPLNPWDVGLGLLYYAGQDAILAVDVASGQVALWNDGAERLFGYPREAAIGAPATDLLPAARHADAGAGSGDLATTPDGPLATAVESSFTCCSGEECWGAFSSLLVTAESGRRYVVTVVRDATARHVAERDAAQRLEAAHERERRREALYRAAQRFAVEADPERLLDVVLEEAAEALGGVLATLRLWDAKQQGLVRRRSTLPSGGFEVVKPGEGVSGQAWQRGALTVVNQVTGDGLRAGVGPAVAVPLVYEGRALGTLSVGTTDPARVFQENDVSTLQVLGHLAAAALLGVEKARLEGVLLAARTAHHHLNNQLATTVGYGEMVVHDAQLPEHLRHYAEEALRGAERAAATLRELLKVTQAEERYTGGLGTVLDLPSRPD